MKALSKYFDTIPHADILRLMARRVVDRNLLWLIKLWLDRRRRRGALVHLQTT
jgi:hypothetical protein